MNRAVSKRTLPFLLLVTVLPLSAADLRIGAARVKITPPLGTPMAGYYNERAAAGVHDDLWAKSIVIENGAGSTALVALDVITTQREFVQEARRLIRETAGIPAENVMISATHAHTGPVISGASSRTAGVGGDEGLAAAYTKALPGLIAKSVRDAKAQLAPAKVFAGIGREESLSFNRRFHMKDGSIGWNPGRLNPNIVRPAGPIDPAVPVLHFVSREGKPLALYVNFSMHLDTVGGLEISADYPYTLAKLLGAVKGTDMLTMFTVGTAGDINHINVQWADQPKGHAEAARIGTILAGAVLRTLPGLEEVPDSPLRCLSATVQLPLPDLRPGDLQRARETIARRGKGGKEPAFLEVVDAFRILDVDERRGQLPEVEVQVITLGKDIAVVGLPGEIFVELGLAVKLASPFKYTAIAELANGSIGYVPTRQAWTQGNYEVVSARCGVGSGELLVETASRLLHQAAARP
jgi:neutral ceramidase